MGLFNRRVCFVLSCGNARETDTVDMEVTQDTFDKLREFCNLMSRERSKITFGDPEPWKQDAETVECPAGIMLEHAHGETWIATYTIQRVEFAKAEEGAQKP